MPGLCPNCQRVKLTRCKVLRGDDPRFGSEYVGCSGCASKWFLDDPSLPPGLVNQDQKPRQSIWKKLGTWGAPRNVPDSSGILHAATYVLPPAHDYPPILLPISTVPSRSVLVPPSVLPSSPSHHALSIPPSPQPSDLNLPPPPPPPEPELDPIPQSDQIVIPDRHLEPRFVDDPLTDSGQVPCPDINHAGDLPSDETVPLASEAEPTSNPDQPPSQEHPPVDPPLHETIPLAPEADPPSKDSQPSSMEAQPPSQEPQPSSMEAQPPSQEPQPPSKEAQPPSQEPQPPSQEPQPPSQEPQPPSQEPQPPSKEAQPVPPNAPTQEVPPAPPEVGAESQPKAVTSAPEPAPNSPNSKPNQNLVNKHEQDRFETLSRIVNSPMPASLSSYQPRPSTDPNSPPPKLSGQSDDDRHPSLSAGTHSEPLSPEERHLRETLLRVISTPCPPSPQVYTSQLLSPKSSRNQPVGPAPPSDEHDVGDYARRIADRLNHAIQNSPFISKDGLKTPRFDTSINSPNLNQPKSPPSKHSVLHTPRLSTTQSIPASPRPTNPPNNQVPRSSRRPSAHAITSRSDHTSDELVHSSRHSTRHSNPLTPRSTNPSNQVPRSSSRHSIARSTASRPNHPFDGFDHPFHRSTVRSNPATPRSSIALLENNSSTSKIYNTPSVHLFQDDQLKLPGAFPSPTPMPLTMEPINRVDPTSNLYCHHHHHTRSRAPSLSIPTSPHYRTVGTSRTPKRVSIVSVEASPLFSLDY